MNYAGFTQPVWAWLRHPEARLPYGGLPLEVPRLPAEAVVATFRAFLGAAPWRASTARGRCSGRTTRPDPQRGPGPSSWSRWRPGCCSPCRAPWCSPGTRSAPRARRRPRHPPAVPLAPARGLGPDHLGPLPRAGRVAPPPPRAAPRRAPLGPREGDAIAFLRESERQRLLVLAAWAGHGPLRFSTGALGLAGEVPNLRAGNADRLRPRRLPDPARRRAHLPALQPFA